jgi:aminoglycoside 6'-N-acetyltransferase
MMQEFLLSHLVLTDGDVVIRSAHRNDEALLTEWLNDPEVNRYWDGPPSSQEYIASHCAPDFADDGTMWPFIITQGDTPVGFIQAWRDFSGRSGMDLFIAPPHRRKGIALRAVRILATHLRDELGWQSVTVDPRANNEAAIALYEKAGFVDTGERQEDEQHQSLMIMEFR